MRCNDRLGGLTHGCPRQPAEQVEHASHHYGSCGERTRLQAALHRAAGAASAMGQAWPLASCQRLKQRLRLLQVRRVKSLL
jgi:hypothetical protein